MFICDICHEQFEDNEMSEYDDICITCADDEDIATLLAIDII